MSLMDFRNFFTTYVFGVKKSIFGSSAELPCSGDFENPVQLPVLHVLEGTDDWVLQIFMIVSSITCRPEVDLDFRSHPNMVARLNCQKWIS